MTDHLPPRIFLSPPHLSGNENEYIQDAIASNWIAPLGPHVDAFEREIASRVGLRGAAAVSSGTAALHLAMASLGVRQGDTVFCPSLTFVATANPIVYLGAEPTFIDVDPDTWNVDVSLLRNALAASADRGALPKAVVIVDLYGQPADYDEILPLCADYDVPVIEDAAESFGATYGGHPAGSFGAAATLSFNGNKIITTSGGGALVSDDLTIVEKSRFLSTQARDPGNHHEHSLLGYNYRLSNLLAAVGRAQLEVLTDRVAARRRIFGIYSDTLGHRPGFRFQSQSPKAEGIRWFTAFTVNEAEAGTSAGRILDALEAQNIEARPVWKPLHLQPLYQAAPHVEGGNAEHIFNEGVCLPSGSALTDDELDRILETIISTIRD